MNTAAALKTTPPKTQQECIVELYALFDEASRGGVLWQKLERSVRETFCRFAGLKQRHVELPLDKFNELDRHKLLKSIKNIEQAAKPFSSLSLQDFK
ncbi:hypothetical protein [Psychromonas aquimarina]|uniref:hypothetical protein n=1 Tax=Psychromonas aquimarina TaxID=444919 RepID=UPI000411A7C2|nr:hypothetical protein [Psychromonas aquimarina]